MVKGGQNSVGNTITIFILVVKKSCIKFINSPRMQSISFHSPIFGPNLIIELLNVQFPPIQHQIRETANLSRMNTLKPLTHPEELWVLPTVCQTAQSLQSD